MLPHEIDHVANLRALVEQGCDRVLAIASVGSLDAELPVGSLLCPDDFIALHLGLSTFGDERAHRAPRFDPAWREEVLAAWSASGGELRDGGVYWQAIGPRFETPAEIRLMAAHADVVGMTIASECIVAAELGLAYAAICVVDNLANGIGAGPAGDHRAGSGAGRQRPAAARRPRRRAAAARRRRAVSAGDARRHRRRPRRRDGRGALRGREDRGARRRTWRRSPATRRSTPAGRRWSPRCVNGHTHAAMTLFRGYGGDLPLMRWLREVVWPIEAKLEPEDVYWGTRLACLEMIRTGTTRFWDMYWHPEATARAVADAGLRATIGGPLFDADGKTEAMQETALGNLDELAEFGPRDRRRARAPLDLHGQRRAAALDRRAGRRARAADPHPPLRDRAGGRGLRRASTACGPPPTSTASAC